MDLEDLEQRKRPAKAKDLSTLSIEELQTYVAELRTEIARAEEVIKGKQAHRSEIESLFRS